ncbi:AtpZ/AtpI family protein [Sphingobacterium zeae]|uniref:F0F1-type ATP synthase assembly protein I n=1 Tax=Sphingobacterium zeae TaxID=1776859 RepID=A0ABU0U280_9SPHI|nr:AtpZ/AtpI family protein [Sphingobacterium zeae]MDQ1149062.1 F0F1-type ATP synthase assembly protein I [Sphingobacterium zeae]
MEDKKDPNKWLVLTTISTQMVFTIYVFYLLGDWLDGKFDSDNQLWMKILTLAGIGISLYQVIRQVNRLNDR